MTNRQRQHLLAYLGYYVGSIDGDWGTLSKTACKAFQDDFGGIVVDGYGGTETDKALRHAVAYDMFRVADAVDVTDNNVGNKTGTFWDEIEFFTREEFRCQCGGKYCNGFPAEPEETMVRSADEIRRRIGKPITVNSGIRCQTHNANVGGVSNSQHLYGPAADLGCPSGISAAQMAATAEAVIGDTGGIGTYSWGIHIDSRAVKSRWNG